MVYRLARQLLFTLCFFLMASAHASELDWDANSWPAPVGGVPTLSQTYAIGGGNVTVTISGDTGALVTTLAPPSPETNNFQTGGLVPAENCLFLRMDFPEGDPPVNAQSITVTYSFDHPGGVNVPSFTVFDLDWGPDQWIDVATSTATLAAGGVINPTGITSGAANTNDGVNTVTGTGGAGNTSADGNATFTFGQSGISEYTFVYSNDVPNVAGSHNQWACMHDISFSYPPTVEKEFSPNSIKVGETSTLTITLGNPEATNAVLSSDLIDTLPANVMIASPANIGGTCPGTTNATAGGTTVTYTSGSVIPPSSCTITVDVTSSIPGTYTNTIPVGDLETNFGNNTIAAMDDLEVVPLIADLRIDKDDSSLTYTPGGSGTYVIRVRNAGPDDVIGAIIQDNLPNGVTLSGPWTCLATAGSSCSAASGGAAGDSAVNLTADILNGGGITITIPVNFSSNMADY